MTRWLEAGTSVSEIIFTASNGTAITAPVNSTGQFSANLPNPGGYTVSVQWAGQYPWQSGSVAINNPISLDVGPGGSAVQSHSVTASTPD